ncbi:MAG: 2-amino-4-hydroxy-6-hydroxymethyldihydropteridine diphosphokinase [Ignavibacteriaceae bacterium]|nr:2-amino-4-hydroxy-6-hydroxymethyldihydropteridine diphosphokinase [Ignavibacteria bacterium]NNJ54163.1 2-amino-4-hydroxy-6-hydroxymethyldihydropteridine diphosphokinase [Ignavibacteriaceae bacterium]
MQINKIDSAIELVDQDYYCQVETVSSIYETKPYGELDQENFFNAVFEIKTYYQPSELFSFLKKVEEQAGRKKTVKWGPREIDLDILFFNNIIFSDDQLTIPHKDLLNRDFVLIPFCEIAPEFEHPELNKKICEICSFKNKTYKPAEIKIKRHIIRKIPHKVLIK